MTDHPAIGPYLRTVLDTRSWTPTDLARACNLPPSVVGRWLRGETTPTVDNSRALANGIGRPLLEILVAAGLITPDEADQPAAIAVLPDPSALSNDELLAEIRRRLTSRAKINPDTDTDRYTAAVPKRRRPASQSK